MNDHIEYIVFGSEHYNPLGIIRSLGEAGISPIAVIVRSNRPFASKSKYIKKLHLVDSIVEGYTLIQSTYNSHNPNCKSIILTGGDDATSILDIHFDELKDGFIFQNAGKKGRITHYMDKKAINELAKEKGFDVLENVVLHKDDDIPDLEYPVITKSISSNAGGKKDVFICHDKEELTEAFSKIKSDPVLVQKYIYKKNELCLDGFSINKGRDVVITMATDYKYILEDSYSQYMNMYSYDDHKVIRILTNMLTEIGYEGIFTIKFLVDKNDNLHFLEINLRNSGWSYACTCVGMNMPVLWSDAMIKGRIASDAIKHIPEGSTAMADLDDFRVRVRRKKMNIFKWYHDFKKCTSVFYYNKMDKKPLFLLLLSRVIRIR